MNSPLRIAAEPRKAIDEAEAEPIVVSRRALARLLDSSVRSIDRDYSAGRLPKALMLGGRKRWRKAEILAWIAAGCPDRKRWEVLKQNERSTSPP
jgi:predicted DNA-binding transcriptional regulator AlpA